MVTTIRSAKIQSDKFLEAFQWAAKLSELIHRKFNLQTRVARNVGGIFSEVHWLTHFDSLGDFEKFRNKLEGDAEYQAMFKEALVGNLFFIESVSDHIYELSKA